MSFNEILVIIFVLMFGVLAINPFDFGMTISMHMTLFALLFVAVVVYAGFFLGEKITDERASAHRTVAGRVSYILGLFTILFGILFQAFMHKPVDTWLIITLMVMVLGKAVVTMLSRIYR